MKRTALLVALVVTGAACATTGPGSTPAPGSVADDPSVAFFWEELGPEPESLVPLDEIVSGGPPPDGIPPIDDPRFIAPVGASWLDPSEPVLALEVDGDARAYPLQIMIWHEIVNDTVGGRPVTVTYCPLCNSGIVFDRRVEGEVTTFGTSGRLYKSDLVMYDRATKSLWPQILGLAVVGPRIGTELDVVPSSVISFADFKLAHPSGKVLSRETGFSRDYGSNPYEGYDTSESPFLFRGETDPTLRATARVLGVRVGERRKGYSLEALFERGPATALNDRFAGTELVVLFKRGTRSALDDFEIARGRDVGSAATFSRTLGSQVLTFRADGDRFFDEQSGTQWDISGRAVGGPLQGRRLEPVESVSTFWFAWSVFVPGAPLWNG